MKKYISIMMLAARNSIYKIMGLLVVTGAVQLGAVRLIADRQTDSINRLQVSEKGIFFIWMIFSTV